MQVIMNADDFGRSASINAAVAQAHREGVLTSASLMVTGEAVEEAVALAKETPSLAVGLHVVVVTGRAALPPTTIPHLVDTKGHFPSDPLRAGLRYFFSATAQKELAQELGAQFERFAATGLPLSHVDGHCHMHMHPTVFPLLLPLAERYGARGLRLPRDELWTGLRYNRQQAVTKTAWFFWMRLLSRRAMRHLSGRRLVVTDRVYGLLQTGRMEEAYVCELLRHSKASTAEFYFHPATAQLEVLGPNPGDLATLLSPAVRKLIQEREIQLVTYPMLRGE